MALARDDLFRHVHRHREALKRKSHLRGWLTFALALAVFLAFVVWLVFVSPPTFEEPSGLALILLILGVVVVALVGRAWWRSLVKVRRLRQDLAEDKALARDIREWLDEKRQR